MIWVRKVALGAAIVGTTLAGGALGAAFVGSSAGAADGATTTSAATPSPQACLQQQGVAKPAPGTVLTPDQQAALRAALQAAAQACGIQLPTKPGLTAQ